MLTTRLIGFVLLMCLPLVSQAQSPLTLDELIKKALDGNLQIKTAVNQQQQALHKIAEVRSTLYPTISAKADYQYYIDIPVQVLPASVFNPSAPPETYLAAEFGVPQSMVAKVDVSQVLFNPQVLIALKAAGLSRQSAALQLRRTQEDIVYNVSATYYNLLTLQRQEELLKSNVQSLETMIKTTQVLVDNQVAKKTDVLRLEVSRKSLLSQLENLKVTQSQLLNVLKILTGTPQEEMLSLAMQLPGETALPVADSTSAAKRTDLQLIELQKSAQLLEQKSIHASLMPSLVAFGSYSRNAFYSEFNPFKSINNRTYPVTVVGLSLNIPVFEGGKKTAQLRSKNIDLQNTDLLLQLQRQQVMSEIDNAKQKLTTNLALVKVQEENLAVAQRIYNDLQLQYREGVASVTDVLNANNELQKAQTDYLTTLVNVRVATLDLNRAGGNLLD